MTPECGLSGLSDVRAATRTSGCFDHRGKSLYPVMEQLHDRPAGGILASGSSSGSSYVATRPIGAALVKSPLVGAGQTHGRALVRLGVPTILRFDPGATFALAVIVTNMAGAPITLERRVPFSRATPHYVRSGRA
jgi:hypothetical protein